MKFPLLFFYIGGNSKLSTAKQDFLILSHFFHMLNEDN